ncbi:MAG: hypothetical protein ACE1ZM_04060 [Gammaproteobacteria bacterium]
MQMIKVVPLALLLGVPSVVVANDFPTRDRVEYVLHCLQELGRNSMDDLQTCSCRLDLVASSMSFETYGYAVTYNRNKRMTGEKGAVFRDNKAGKRFSKDLTAYEETSKSQCRQVVQIVAPTDLTGDKRYERYDEEIKLQ